MQDLLAELLWRNEEIPEAANRLCQTLPGFAEAQQSYDALAEQMREAVGPSLYDEYYNHLMRYTGYEVRAYYSLGLGLRETIVQSLGV